MSKRTMEELTTHVAELREAVSLLQAIVREQQEDIQMLKAHVQKLELESALSSSGGTGPINIKHSSLSRSGTSNSVPISSPMHFPTARTPFAPTFTSEYRR